MAESSVTIEINRNFQQAADSFVADGNLISVTPPLDENYWLLRVPLKHGQAIVAFPKFGVIGCGFAKEEDWNTNLPITCAADEIYSHIEHNKGYSDISKDDCIRAIKAIQKLVTFKEK